MPPIRIPVNRLSQAVRTVSSLSPGMLGSRQQQLYLHRHVLHHAPSQRILTKASAARHSLSFAQFPEAVRDVTSYLALGALTSEAAFSIYCWDQDVDLADFLAV